MPGDTERKSHDTLTNTEDVEAESMVDRLVDQLVRHAVKANMARQRNSTSSFTLKTKDIKQQVSTFQPLSASHICKHAQPFL